jgi:hypothetical protein
VAGLNDNPVTTGGLTVSVAVALADPSVAVTTALFTVPTLIVVAVKLCEALPAGTTTLAGTMTEGSELLSATLTPPVGAAELSETLPVDPAPPIRDVGEKLIDPRDGETSGFTVSVPAAVVEPVEPTTIAISELLTEPVVTENV